MIALDLLKIQNTMDSSGDQARPNQEDNDLRHDEDVDDQHNWLGVPVNLSPYHRGYTTHHWLQVFRQVKATA